MTDLQSAYDRCEEITKHEAKNFAYGIRLLPPDRRRAMAALYALARRIDDIGDGDAPVADKLVALEAVRSSLVSVTADTPDPGDPVLVALADAAQRYPIPVAALGELIDGCEMDCRQVGYESYEDLVVYCRCVAGSIGRLSLGVFGAREGDHDRAEQLADTLGIALQVTNILRDVLEDRTAMGRVYLPREDLARFGCESDGTGPPEAMSAVIRYEAARAWAAYEEGLQLLDLLDHRSRACVAAMAGIYRRLLKRIEADPSAVLVRRVSLPTWEKAWVAARSLAGAGV
ncbi:MAG: presqualene diphosphate synthase HpnD [Acidimicrobiales bacterium]